MSVVGSLAQDLWDLLRILWHELAALVKTPWKWRLVADYTGAPDFPVALMDRIRELASRDVDAQHFADSLDVIQAVHDLYKLAYATDSAERTFEALLRLLLPLLVAGLRRDQAHPKLALGLLVVQLADDQLADQFAGFTSEQLARVFGGGVKVADSGQPITLLPMAIPIAVWGLLHWPRFKEFLHLHDAPVGDLRAGWESELLDRGYGKPEAWRPTPYWMAQRTSSVHWTPPYKFKLDRYDNATPEPEPTKRYGFTVVPIPKKLVWPGGPPTPDGPEPPFIADPGKPGMWLQLDGEIGTEFPLGGGWTLRIDAPGGAGGRIPLTSPGDALQYDAGADLAIQVELRWAPTKPPVPPTAPTENVLDVQLAGFSILGSIGGGFATPRPAVDLDDLVAAIRVSKAQVTITPDGEILRSLLGDRLTTTVDLGLVYSAKHGDLRFEGGNGLDIYLQGFAHAFAGLTLSYLRITGIHEQRTTQTITNGQETDLETTDVGIQLTAGVAFNFLRITLVLDGIGGRLVATTKQPGGNLLGLGNLDLDLVRPQGLGLKIDWGPVQGGGFFSHDPVRDRYAGAIAISIGGTAKDPTVSLRGVGFTEPRGQDPNGKPSGDQTTVAVLTAEWPRTFFLVPTGAGAMIGLHRTANIPAIRDALPTGALDAILFPEDPVGRSAQLIAALATMFPAAPAEADTHVFGLLLKWSFVKNFARLALGFITEWTVSTGSLNKIVVPFSLIVGDPAAARVLWIEVYGVGDYDRSTHEFEIRGTLRNSRLCGGDLVGGMVVFHGDPDPDDQDATTGTFVSIGGYHPSYFGGKGPGRAAVDKRLGIVVTHGDDVRLEVSGYLAYSPVGFHFGILGHVKVEESGFGIDGKLWLDGLIYGWGEFVLDVGGSVALILFHQTVTELSFEGELSASPWHLAGKVSFKVLWWSVSKHTSRNLSDEVATTVQAEDVHAALATALVDPASYPNKLPDLVALVDRERSGIWSAPEKPFVLVQKIAPLDTPIERLGGKPLAAPVTLTRGAVTVGTSTLPPQPALTEFAPALYLALDTDAAVQAPMAELWPGGFSAADEVGCDDAVAATASFDEIVVDRQHVPRKKIVQWHPSVLATWQATALAPARPAPIRVKPARFASTATALGTSFAAAWAARGTAIRRTEGSR